MQSVGYERRPILVVFREASRIKETYAGRTDTVALEAHHLALLEINGGVEGEAHLSIRPNASALLRPPGNSIRR